METPAAVLFRNRHDQTEISLDKAILRRGDLGPFSQDGPNPPPNFLGTHSYLFLDGSNRRPFLSSLDFFLQLLELIKALFMTCKNKFDLVAVKLKALDSSGNFPPLADEFLIELLPTLCGHALV